MMCGQDIFLVIFDKEEKRLITYKSEQDFVIKNVVKTMTKITPIEEYDNRHYENIDSRVSPTYVEQKVKQQKSESSDQEEIITKSTKKRILKTNKKQVKIDNFIKLTKNIS